MTDSDRPTRIEQDISVVQCMTLVVSVLSVYTCSGQYSVCISGLL